MPSGPERSDGHAASKRAWGVNPSHHCQEDHMRMAAALFTLLLHFPCSLACGLYLTGGWQISFITTLSLPPSLWIVSLEVFMGRPTGCSAHQEIKVSPTSKCAFVRCDLFNSGRVNVTDACKAGITVARLDGHIMTGDPFPSCCGLHTRIGAQFAVMDGNLQDGDHSWGVQSCSYRSYQSSFRSGANKSSREKNAQLQFHLSRLIDEEHRPAWLFFVKESVFLTFSKNNTEAK